MLNGLLLLDKPVDMRSTDCVNMVKHTVGRGVRVGHAGTLDSTASGLLIVLLGLATRLSDYIMRMKKVYRVDVQLGLATDTCDYSGASVFEGDASAVTERDLDRLLYQFLGVRMQRPPEVSALKVDGRASHKWVRAGLAQDLAARPIAITSIRRLAPLTAGRTELAITCGKGTYIRSVVRDLGELLSCGAHVAGLRRTSVGPFDVSHAFPPADLSSFSEKMVLPPDSVAAVFHRIVLNADSERKLLCGLAVPMAEAGAYLPGQAGLATLCVSGKNIIGFADVTAGEDGAPLLKPHANIPLNVVQTQ